MSFRLARSLILLLLCTVLLSGCFGSTLINLPGENPPESRGTLAMSMDLTPLATQSIAVTRVAITLTHSSGTVVTGDLAISNQTATGTFENLKVGSWTIAVTIYDASDHVRGTGTTTANVVKNATTTANLSVSLSGFGELVVNVVFNRPSGNLVAFATHQDDGSGGTDYGLYTMNADGGNLHAITSIDGNAIHPALSPDNRTIAYSSWDSGVVDLFSIGVDGNNARPLKQVSDAPISYASWSPGGSQIAYMQASDIRIMDLDGSNDHSVMNVGSDTPIRTLAWSPNGDKIAFVKDYGKSIQIIDTQGNAVGSIVPSSGQAVDHPSWSPDGNKLVYSLRTDLGPELWTADATGHNQTQIPNVATGGFIRGISWARDGDQKIFFVSNNSGDDEIYAINPDGSDGQQLTNLGGTYIDDLTT